MSGVLSNKDINVPMLAAEQPTGKPIQSMEYHRQVLQSKMDAEQSVQRLSFFPPNTRNGASLTHPERPRWTFYPYNRQNKQYVSPSDNIMSPCTAKLTALRNKQVGK